MAKISTLLDEISSEKNLHSAWIQLNRSNENSFGLSGESIKDFKANLNDKIESLSKNLLSQKFNFSPNRAAAIPKDNGKFRPLQIPEISDRLVLKSIAIALEKELSKIVKDSVGVSFAYQKGTGIRDAMNKLETLYRKGNTTILEADIVNFFGEVNKHNLLSNKVFPNLRDPTINHLIEDALSQSIGGLDKIRPELRHLFESLNNGIPQGNPLSPLLSNIYLSSFDKQMKMNGYGLIRYADDFIILTKDRTSARKAYKQSLNILEEELKLKVHPIDESNPNAKTKILNPESEIFSFLSITFDGKDFYPSRKSVDRFLKKIERIINSKKSGGNVLSILQNVRNSLDGWISNFSYTDLDRYFEEIDSFINRQIYLRLRIFDWRFTRNSKGKLKTEFVPNEQNNERSRECLSLKQRRNSGIPLCNDIVKEKRKKSISSEKEDGAEQSVCDHAAFSENNNVKG